MTNRLIFLTTDKLPNGNIKCYFYNVNQVLIMLKKTLLLVNERDSEVSSQSLKNSTDQRFTHWCSEGHYDTFQLLLTGKLISSDRTITSINVTY